MALAQGRPALLREAFPHMLFVFDDQFGDGVAECVAVLGQADRGPVVADGSAAYVDDALVEDSTSSSATGTKRDLLSTDAN